MGRNGYHDRKSNNGFFYHWSHDDFFIWDRFRYDLIAICTLLIACIVGLVSPKEAFSGFSNDIVIIVGSVFVVSTAVSRSGIMEFIIQRIWPEVKSVRLQLAFLVISVVLLSMFVKNIGALAIMLPIAFNLLVVLRFHLLSF